MLGFEQRSSGTGSIRSANFATTPALCIFCVCYVELDEEMAQSANCLKLCPFLQVLLRHVHHRHLDQVFGHFGDLPQVADHFLGRKEGHDDRRGRQPHVRRHPTSCRHDGEDDLLNSRSIYPLPDVLSLV